MAIRARSASINPVVVQARSGDDGTPPERAALFGSRRATSATGPARARALDSLDLAVADRRRTDRRRHAERLVQRAAWLRSDERAVIEAVYGEGRTCTELARLMDVSADAVRRKVRRATRRAASGLFGFVVTRRAEWSPARRRVATKCVLEGATLRTAAVELGMSLHSVRKHWDAIRALFEAESAGRRERQVDGATERAGGGSL